MICGRRALWATAVMAAILGLGFTATATAATAARGKTLGGVVADVPTGHHSPPLARIGNLPYGNGPVMHANRTHLIFWQPSGSTLAYDPGYQVQAETFLARVAQDSHKPTNVYGLSGQYRDAEGPAAYSSSYGGAVVTTDPLPANRCIEPLGPPLSTGPGWGVCLNDFQLEQEIAHVVSADHLPNTSRDLFILMLPNGFGTCQESGPGNCALGGQGAGGSFCGYHSSNADETLLYAVIPYNAVSGHCQSDNPRPNGSTADPALSTLSHEHNEVITDPLGNAYIDGQSNEDGDLCIDQFGAALGGSGPGAYNQVIGGGHYFLQEEWSNQNGGCRQRPDPDSVSFSLKRSVRARVALKLTAHARAAHGSIAAYSWFFGNGPAGRRRVVTHAFSRAGTYRVVLRVTDSASNWTFATHTIKVTKPPARDRRRRRH
jgi:PKD domain